MIEFDDAGGGCPLLGEVFVARRVETDEHVFGYLPPTAYWRHTSANKVLKGMLEQINLQPEEEIVLCRGDIFDKFQRSLKHNQGIIAKRAKIEGRTNDLAEQHFTKLLHEAGVPETIVNVDRNFATYHYQIWVWYSTFCNDKSLIKESFNIKKYAARRDVGINKVQNYPNLLAQVMGIVLPE